MQGKTSRYYSHGKLLISGEYLILDGATGLALPTKKGQHLEVTPNLKNAFRFTSVDEKDSEWFNATLDHKVIAKLAKGIPIKTGEAIKNTSDPTVAKTLVHMLTAIYSQRPELYNDQGLDFRSTLEFARDWGLGSSSTFINNLAQWSKTNPYTILKASLGGSGYDIACAGSEHPLTYKLIDGAPEVNQVRFNPSFKDQLYFVHLNKKQNSREGIANYRALPQRPEQQIAKVNEITRELLVCNDLTAFENLMVQHEAIISSLLEIKTVKEALFPDYNGHLKSLGAWGGDFILATAASDPLAYFKEKGYSTVIPYKDMIL